MVDNSSDTSFFHCGESKLFINKEPYPITVEVISKHILPKLRDKTITGICVNTKGNYFITREYLKSGKSVITHRGDFSSLKKLIQSL